MIEFEVRERIMPIGAKKGQTVYYAAPKTHPKMTVKQVEDKIVSMTSLARGDVRNALASLSDVVNSALRAGVSVDLSDLGTIKVEEQSKMEDKAENVSAASLKTPAIKFYPKTALLAAAKSVKVRVTSQYAKTVSEP